MACAFESPLQLQSQVDDNDDDDNDDSDDDYYDDDGNAFNKLRLGAIDRNALYIDNLKNIDLNVPHFDNLNLCSVYFLGLLISHSSLIL